MYTLYDAVQHGMDFLGASASAGKDERDVRNAVRAAYIELGNAHEWGYLYKHERLWTNAPYETGTLAYDHTGGAYERLVTLTGGTWPSWAANGVLLVNNVIHKVQQRVSNSQLTLDASVNPGADIAAGTSYTLYQESHDLPEDFGSTGDLDPGNLWTEIGFITPQNWLAGLRSYPIANNPPSFYAIMRSPTRIDRFAVRFETFPSAQTSIDFIYRRRPRTLRYVNTSEGLITTTSASKTVTTTQPVFTSAMVGSILRVSSNATKEPTDFAGGSGGQNLAAIEDFIDTVVSTTQATLRDNAPASYSGVKYVVTDPIDIDESVMLIAFQRGIEVQLWPKRRLEAGGGYIVNPERAYQNALLRAKEADTKYAGWRSAVKKARGRFINLPIGADIA